MPKHNTKQDRLRYAIMIMRVMRSNPDGLDIHQLSKAVGLSFTGCRRVMSALEENGVIFSKQPRKRDELAIYQITHWGPFQRPLRAPMNPITVFAQGNEMLMVHGNRSEGRPQSEQMSMIGEIHPVHSSRVYCVSMNAQNGGKTHTLAHGDTLHLTIGIKPEPTTS